jgi:hypothetical protein
VSACAVTPCSSPPAAHRPLPSTSTAPARTRVQDICTGNETCVRDSCVCVCVSAIAAERARARVRERERERERGTHTPAWED